MAAVEPPAPLVYRPPTAPWLNLLYEDAAVLAFDKPAELLTTPGKPEDQQDSLENRARKTYPGARIVHRLDHATSGVVVMARGYAACQALGRAFERRETRKTYIARVDGVLAEEAGVVDVPLCTDWPRRPLQMAHHAHGKPAETRWRVVTREADATRVELTPVTGRTHQLRVHMAWLGHPILGDPFYAPPGARAATTRLQLHAARLEAPHPIQGAPFVVEAPCPF